jgi:hypothetical protein
MAGQAPQVVTAAQLASMSPAQQQAYFNNLPPDQAAQQQAQLVAYKRGQNAAYLAQAVRKIAVAPPVSGGTTQAWAAGASLLYNFPTAAGAFAAELLITANLTVTPATGTSATYFTNPSAPWSVFQEVQVLYNGMQCRLRPYLIKVFDTMRGYAHMAPIGGNTPGGVAAPAAAGNQLFANATLSTALYSGVPAVVGSANTWNFVFRIPLNALHQLSAEGMLPMQGSGTKPQVNIICAGLTMADDPLLFPLSANGGSGNAVTITGTVKCEIVYYDGTNFGGPNPISLDITGLPTVQYIIETPLTPLAGGVMQRQRIAALLQHYYVVSILIDAQQKGAFATVGNIVNLELDQDSVGQNRFFAFGQSNNVSPNDFFENIRRTFGQDLDAGVIPWIAAEAYNTEDADTRMGTQVLNMTAGGWTDVHHAYQVTAVGAVATITPRVETFLVSLNPAGLVLV